MEQLSTLDAGFLQAEDSDRHVSLAIGAIAVLAGPMPDFDVLTTELAERITSAPRFTQVLRTHPLDLGAPSGWTTPTSTSRTMCAGRRCRGPATTRPCSGGPPT